jgi:hypothetical protein
MRYQFSPLLRLKVPPVHVQSAGQLLGVGVVGDVVSDYLVINAHLVSDAAAMVAVNDSAVLVHGDWDEHAPLLD